MEGKERREKEENHRCNFGIMDRFFEDDVFRVLSHRYFFLSFSSFLFFPFFFLFVPNFTLILLFTRQGITQGIGRNMNTSFFPSSPFFFFPFSSSSLFLFFLLVIFSHRKEVRDESLYFFPSALNTDFLLR